MKAGAIAVGDRAVWHMPLKWNPYSDRPTADCRCDQSGVVEAMREQGDYAYVYRLKLDSGEVIDPSISPDELTLPGAECPWRR